LTASFPGHRGFYHARYGLRRVERLCTDEEVPQFLGPLALTQDAPPGATADDSGRRDHRPPRRPRRNTSFAPGRSGSSYDPLLSRPSRSTRSLAPPRPRTPPPPPAGVLPIATKVNVPPANLERFLPADRLRHLLQA
jgi:hypothetical protein